MSAQPADAYRRMWEDVDNEWDFGDVPVDGDWTVWDEPPGADRTVNDFDPFYTGGNYSSDTFDHSSPDRELDFERITDHRSHDSRIPTASTSLAPVMGNSSSAAAIQPQPSHSRTNPASSSITEQTSVQPAPDQQRRSRPVPDHSDDWLDPTTAGHSHSFGNIHDEIFETLSESVSSESFTSARSPSYHPDGDHQDENMPSTRRSRAPQRGGGGVVDLTNDRTSPAIVSSRKRGRDEVENIGAGTANKRSRPSTSQAQTQRTVNIEELDMTNENPSAEEELLRSQQAKTIAAQQASDEPTGPLKVGQRQCIICMENYTNATVTHCGHIYCHECLWQALKAGEKNSERGVGNCPVCRKPVKKGDPRKDGKGANFVAVSFMKKSAFKGKGRRTDPSLLG